MNTAKEKIELRNANIPLSFGIKLSADNGKVTINYVDDYEGEVIYDFYSFLEDLSQYYRNRIDVYDSFEEKLNLCNKFLDTIQGYKMNFRNVINDPEKFFKEIEFHKEQFNYYKGRFKESGDLQVSENKSKIVKYSLPQQILILEYLGILKHINSFELTEKQKAEIIISFTGQNLKNTITAIRNRYKIGEKGLEFTKTRKTLSVVKDFFIKHNFHEIANKIQQEINSIKKE